MTSPMWMVMTDGLGMETMPIMLAPSASGGDLISTSVMFSPSRPLRPVWCTCD